MSQDFLGWRLGGNAKVEHDLEHEIGRHDPLGRQKRRAPAIGIQKRLPIAVADPLGVAVRIKRFVLVVAVGLMSARPVNSRGIFGLVGIDNRIATIVARL